MSYELDLTKILAQILESQNLPDLVNIETQAKILQLYTHKIKPQHQVEAQVERPNKYNTEDKKETPKSKDPVEPKKVEPKPFIKDIETPQSDPI